VTTENIIAGDALGRLHWLKLVELKSDIEMN
jgi:hypothetical protein